MHKTDVDPMAIVAPHKKLRKEVDGSDDLDMTNFDPHEKQDWEKEAIELAKMSQKEKDESVILHISLMHSMMSQTSMMR